MNEWKDESKQQLGSLAQRVWTFLPELFDTLLNNFLLGEQSRFLYLGEELFSAEVTQLDAL